MEDVGPPIGGSSSLSLQAGMRSVAIIVMLEVDVCHLAGKWKASTHRKREAAAYKKAPPPIDDRAALPLSPQSTRMRQKPVAEDLAPQAGLGFAPFGFTSTLIQPARRH
jgi:hypothetical protein